MKTIIGLSGYAGSGKSTVSSYLVNEHGATRVSFAGALKDITATLFGWDRDMVEGATPQSRAWRDTPDVFWSPVFGKDITPRYMLQFMGTEVMRNSLHRDIWVQVALNKIRMLPENSLVVVDDVRFVNERNALRDAGAVFWQISRLGHPTLEHRDIYNAAMDGTLASREYTPPTLHPSEWDWMKDDTTKDIHILNTTSFDELYADIDLCLGK